MFTIRNTKQKKKTGKCIKNLDMFHTDVISWHIYDYFYQEEYPVLRKLVSLKDIGLLPVSYTHLDVYKRQECNLGQVNLYFSHAFSSYQH